MAVVSTSRRSTAGIVLIVAGVLFLLGLLLPLANIAVPWLTTVSYIAIAAALAILAIGAVNNTVAKIALFAAAVGWLVLALAAFAVLPAAAVVPAALVAAIGGVVGAIVLYVGKEITNISALVFIAATVLGLLYLLNITGTIPLGAVVTFVAALFGIALVLTGFLFRSKGRRR